VDLERILSLDVIDLLVFLERMEHLGTSVVGQRKI
jgi:hypothetical protein